MKTAGYLIIFLTLTFLGLISCSEDEMQADGIEPFIQVTFIDTDSLVFFTGLKTDVESSISTIDSRIEGIDSLENRNDFADEKDSLNLVKDNLQDSISSLNSLISDVNSGLTFLSNVNSIVPTVSRREIHTFPLNSNDSVSRFITIIYNHQDTIDIHYNLELQFKENQLRAIASELDVDRYNTFDSVKLSCDNCISNEAILTVYF